MSMSTENLVSITDISAARRATSKNLTSLLPSSPPKGLSLLQQSSLSPFPTDDVRKIKQRIPSLNQSFAMGSAFSFIRAKLLIFIGDPLLVDDLLATDSTASEIQNFLKADGPRKLTFFYQVICFLKIDTAADLFRFGMQPKSDEAGSKKSVTSSLFVANLESEQAESFVGKCIYFARQSSSEVRLDHMMEDVVCGSLEHPFLESMDLMLSELFVPLLRHTSELEKLSKEE